MIIISLENGTTVSIEDKRDSKKISFSLEKFKKLVELFSDNCSISPYSGEDISNLESSLSFKLGPKTKEMLKFAGNLKVADFEVPKADGLIKLTNEWKNSVATNEQKEKFIVIVFIFVFIIFYSIIFRKRIEFIIKN